MSAEHTLKKRSNEEFDSWSKSYDKSVLQWLLFDPSHKMIVRELGDGLLGLTPAAARLGEFDDTLRQIAQEIAASVEYTGTTEALLKEIMGPLDLEIEPQDGNSATLDKHTTGAAPSATPRNGGG